METFGKSGCRRIVPGQYLAVDPKGRALMIGELTCPGKGEGSQLFSTGVSAHLMAFLCL